MRRFYAGNLMVVALADVEGLQKVAYFTLKNLYQPGDIIHTTYVEDAAGTGGRYSMSNSSGMALSAFSCDCAGLQPPCHALISHPLHNVCAGTPLAAPSLLFLPAPSLFVLLKQVKCQR